MSKLLRQGGPSASNSPQNGDPALACTALVRHIAVVITTDSHSYSAVRLCRGER